MLDQDSPSTAPCQPSPLCPQAQALEELIDAKTLAWVLTTLADICNEQAEHLSDALAH